MYSLARPNCFIDSFYIGTDILCRTFIKRNDGFGFAAGTSTFRSQKWQLFQYRSSYWQSVISWELVSFSRKKYHLKRCNTTWRISNFLQMASSPTAKPIDRRLSLRKTCLKTKVKQFNSPKLTCSLEVSNSRQISTRPTWIRNELWKGAEEGKN